MTVGGATSASLHRRPRRLTPAVATRYGIATGSARALLLLVTVPRRRRQRARARRPRPAGHRDRAAGSASLPLALREIRTGELVDCIGEVRAKAPASVQFRLRRHPRRIARGDDHHRRRPACAERRRVQRCGGASRPGADPSRDLANALGQAAGPGCRMTGDLTRGGVRCAMAGIACQPGRAATFSGRNFLPHQLPRMMSGARRITRRDPEDARFASGSRRAPERCRRHRRCG